MRTRALVAAALAFALPHASRGALDAQTFEMPIDHFGATKGTFANRWWYNATWYKAGGPVILLDVGQADASESLDKLIEPAGTQSPTMQLAQRYHGLAILFEHRYYGESVPPGVSGDVLTLTTQQLAVLTVDQALEDVVTFARNFSLPADAAAAAQLSSADALRPVKTPWVFVGGGYSGTRAALLRVRNPDVIYAAWASSAPVQAAVDGHAYYDAIARALSANCSADTVAAVQWADAPHGPVESASDPGTFGFELAGPFGQFEEGGLASVSAFCDALETNGTLRAPTSAGVAAGEGAQVAYERYLAAAQDVSQSGSAVRARQQAKMTWSFAHYQTCSELGGFLTANANASASILSKHVDVAYWQRDCTGFFEGIVKTPAVDHVNKYGGWSMAPRRTFFTHGELDPWRGFGVASTEPDRPNEIVHPRFSPGFDYTNGTYYGVVYPGQVHVVDLSSSPQSSAGQNAAFAQGLQMFTKALDVWLPAFGTSEATDPPPKNFNAAPKPATRWMSSMMCVCAVLMVSWIG